MERKTIPHLRFRAINLSVLICVHLWLISTFCYISFAQSGRVKPTETSIPPPPPSRIVYVPTQNTSQIPTPTPAVKSNGDEDDGDIIRVDSLLVPIPVSVINLNGRAVEDLKLSDFSLLVDEKAAEISELARSETPVRLAVLFDNSSSVTQAREFEKKAAIKFFKRVLRPDKDLAALYSIATGSRLEQPLTKNTAQLAQAIENFAMPQGATALLDGIIKAANYLKETHGRRVIVIVSDGEDTISDATFEETVKAVQATNCQVYVVKTTDFENFKKTGLRGGNANIRVLAAERRMQEIAAQTGGAVYSPIDERELDQAFDQLAAELSQQYILSYYPEERDKVGQFRAISLKIKGRENLSVRTRKGYYVDKR
jgi:Ca-activated chloride channel family protein